MAQSLTGWTQEEAEGLSLDLVFRIVHEETRLPVESPVTKALREGTIVGLANHTLLIARDGTEISIGDSASPIRNEHGEVSGVVLIFRDASEQRQVERVRQNALRYAEDITEGLPETELRLAREEGRAEDERWHVRKNGELFWALGFVAHLVKPVDMARLQQILTSLTALEPEERP